MLFNIIILFIILIISLYFIKWKSDTECFNIPVPGHTEYVSDSQDKFSKVSNLIDLTNPALPLNQDSKMDIQLALSDTYPVSIPVSQPDNFKKAGYCESKTATCDAFDDHEFSANCGMSFDQKGTSFTGKPHIGGKFVSEFDRKKETPQPTLGTSRPGTFALTKDSCIVMKETLECSQKQTFNSPNCTQCYTSQQFHRVDPSSNLLPSSIQLYGNGSVSVTSTNNKIILQNSTLSTSGATIVNIPADSEGTEFTINLTEGSTTAPYISGFLIGQTARGSFKFDILQLIKEDAISGKKPKVGGSNIYDGFRCFVLLPASGKNSMNLQCLMPFTFLGLYDGDTKSCDNGPILRQASSATFLESDPCFNKKNSPGNYSLDCLQSRWIELGGTTSGTGYPSDKTKADLIQKDKNGNPIDIDTIMNSLYPKMTQALTGQNADGSSLRLSDWNSISMWATGTPINTPCDGTDVSRECLSYLYNNQGITSHIGATYSLPNSENASMITGSSTYCQPNAPLDPMTDSGYSFIKDVAQSGGISAVKNTYDKINRDANNNTLDNTARADAIYKCYGLQIDTMSKPITIPMTSYKESTQTTQGNTVKNNILIALSGGNTYYADENIFSDDVNWTQISGNATTLSVTSSGILFATTTDGNIVYRDKYNTTTNWLPIQGAYTVQLDNDDTYLVSTNTYNRSYYITINDAISGKNWTQFPGNPKKVVINSGKVYSLGLSNQVFYLSQVTSQQWVSQTYNNTPLQFIDIALGDSVVLLLTSNNTLYYSDDGIYTPNANLVKISNQPTPFKQISASGSSVFATDINGTFWYTIDYKNPTWKQITGSGTMILYRKLSK